MKNANQQINIFIAYSRADNHFLQKIRTHLKFLERKKEIVTWYDGEIIAGSFWDNAITYKLENADMVLLLVSADALASDYFHKKEMQRALERHAKKEALVIPVILKPCFWQDDLGDIQALPKDGKPIVKWRLKSDAYYNIATGVRESLGLVKQLKAKQLKLEEPKLNLVEKKIENAKNETIITLAPTAFVHYRISKAFPAVRGLKWFKNEDAINGLSRFLKKPLKFDSAVGYGIHNMPLWWFRGGSASAITEFKVIENNKILLNNDELIIDKIAVFNSRSYYQSFIYIQTLPDKPSGAYKINNIDIERVKLSRGYYYEAFGIFDKNIITHEEHEDEAAIIDGKYVELINSELRVRYLTKYNLILAAKSSPINSRKGNLLGTKYMNAILQETKQIEEYVEEVLLLSKSRIDI